MRILICSALWLLASFTTAFGQNEKERPILLGRVDAGSEDVLNAIYKVGMALESSFDRRHDTFAVRVCSNDPLPVALTVAKGLPFVTILKLEKLGIPRSRMYYLRQSKKCRVLPNKHAVTEYWLIPRNAEFPEFDEARMASHLSGYQLTNS